MRSLQQLEGTTQDYKTVSLTILHIDGTSQTMSTKLRPMTFNYKEASTEVRTMSHNQFAKMILGISSHTPPTSGGVRGREVNENY
jgi:hypothetical protein